MPFIPELGLAPLFRSSFASIGYSSHRSHRCVCIHGHANSTISGHHENNLLRGNLLQDRTRPVLCALKVEMTVTQVVSYLYDHNLADSIRASFSFFTRSW